MKIDLNDKLTRFLVQEYVNAILSFQSPAELGFDIHKLIHTFEVVKVADRLIELSPKKLSPKLKKQIHRAALLHDVGRCYEFKNGKPRKGYNHGAYGAEIIKKHFPNLVVEQICTAWHNRQPTDQDPALAEPVLDYTRDSDMLGNIIYNTEHMSVFLEHILSSYRNTPDVLILNPEVHSAAREERACNYAKMGKLDFLDMMVAQLFWIYNLKTEAAFRLAKKEKLFPHYRDALIAGTIPAIVGTQKQRQKAIDTILKLFPDSLFEKEFARHGL